MSQSGVANELIRLSPAKINWNLKVLARRPDGYHEIESLVSPITLYDELTFRPRTQVGFELVCATPGLPLDDRNLIVRAARTLAEATGRPPGAVCRLCKRIPIGGGLGGGSSNAAAALRGLNRLWRLGRSDAELATMAARIGSDVPFFLHNSSGILRGRGERVEPVALQFGGTLVLLLPGIPVSTAAVYAAWRKHSAQPVPDRPILPPREGNALAWMQLAFNDLESAALVVCPAIGPLLEQAAGIAGRPVRMSGSGSTCFTAFDTAGDAEAFATEIGRRLRVETRLVQVRSQEAAADDLDCPP